MSDSDGHEPINPDVQPSDDTDWRLGRMPAEGDDADTEELTNG